MFLFLLGEDLGLRWLGHMKCVWKTDWQFLKKCICHLCILTNDVWDFQFFFILSSAWYCQAALILGCSGQCLVVSHYSFNLHFPNY